MYVLYETCDCYYRFLLANKLLVLFPHYRGFSISYGRGRLLRGILGWLTLNIRIIINISSIIHRLKFLLVATGCHVLRAISSAPVGSLPSSIGLLILCIRNPRRCTTDSGAPCHGLPIDSLSPSLPPNVRNKAQEAGCPTTPRLREPVGHSMHTLKTSGSTDDEIGPI